MIINWEILVQHHLKEGKTTFDSMNENITENKSTVFLRIVFIVFLALILYVVIFGIYYIVIDIVT
jgi:succinate dehydrogenase/fumarate reductase cytochrome b subunit